MDPSLKRTDEPIEANQDTQGNDAADPLEEPVKHGQSSSQLERSEHVEKQGPEATKVAPSPSMDNDDVMPVDLTPLGDFSFYRPSLNHVAKTTREDLPSDFLEPTADDLKAAQALLVSRSKAYQDAPLLTENLRNKRDQEIRNRWPTTTIRIKFADRSILEKTFPSTYPIKPVYAFVRACLREDAIAHKFVLFMTPPRRDLKVSDPAVREKSLFDLHLAPRSVLHFRFLEDNLTLDPPAGPPPLLPAILSRAIDLPLPSSQDTESSAASPPTGRPTSTSTKPPDQPEKDKKIARLLKLAKGKR